ncbi:MAG: hypothetical protein JWO19_473 [Bryobacterales bacterium]|nr:hypothetical protein [Bryobacterales bacterium]
MYTLSMGAEVISRVNTENGVQGAWSALSANDTKCQYQKEGRLQ